MNPPDLPQTPHGEQVSSVLRWIGEARRVLADWMRRVEQNKQIRLFGPYTVTAGDVTAGAITFSTNLKQILAYSFRIRTASNNNTELAWTGTVATTEGRITFTNAGATPFAAGQVFHVELQGE
jgi:hypothetical protein